MTTSGAPRRLFNTAIKTFAASGPGAWLFARTAHHLDRWTLQATGGRTTLAGALGGLPVVTLSTVGAKSGQPRSVPLVALPDGNDLAIIASNFGQRHYPGWYYNLRAHPDVTVTREGVPRTYTAREATPDERARLWQQALAIYPGYHAYERRAAGRSIPIFILTPQ